MDSIRLELSDFNGQEIGEEKKTRLEKSALNHFIA